MPKTTKNSSKHTRMRPSPKSTPHTYYHKDGSVWAKGHILDGAPCGYWEWFRRNGVRMRSGYFEKGRQTGEWTTYDRDGNVYKVTIMKATVNR